MAVLRLRQNYLLCELSLRKRGFHVSSTQQFHSPARKQRWFPSFWALSIEGRPPAMTSTENLDHEEASSRGNESEERNVHDLLYRMWLLKLVFLSKACAAEEKRNEHWAGFFFFQTPPILDCESWGENNSEPQHLTLHHPDFLLQEGGIPEGLNCAKNNRTFFSLYVVALVPCFLPDF